MEHECQQQQWNRLPAPARQDPRDRQQDQGSGHVARMQVLIARNSAVPATGSVNMAATMATPAHCARFSANRLRAMLQAGEERERESRELPQQLRSGNRNAGQA